MKRPFRLLLAIYLIGVVLSFGIDWYSSWSAGAAEGFAFTDALVFATYWPLRAYWQLV